MAVSPLLAVIDARLVSGHHGGVEQVIIGLAHGLSSLDGDDEFVFHCFDGQSAYLEPYVHGPCRMVVTPRPFRQRAAHRLPALAAVGRRVRRGLVSETDSAPVPPSDGTAERLGAEVVHFPRQDGYLTQIPSIFHPHDLQHVHLPDFFTAAERRHRDLWYRTLAKQASLVSVTSEWGKRDLVANLGLPPGKIAVIPLAPALAAYGSPLVDTERERLLGSLGIVRPFALYPAQTWPHKNHLRLVGALRKLHDRGVIVDLMCTGAPNEHTAAVETAVGSAGLREHLRLLGYVSEDQLKALYASARCLIMPTLFEAAGGFGPVAEAFLAGVPVACSNVASLPEQVGDAALLFDPLDEDAIAGALERLWTDAGLRDELVRRGRQNIRHFSWDRVARTFRAHYRKLAGRPLDPDDVALLDARVDF